MNLSSGCFSAAVILVALSGAVSANGFEFTGSAENREGEPLYVERHQVEGACENGVFRPLEHRVTYTRQTEGNGEPFAEKSLVYRPSAIRPTVDFRQPDFGESLKITYPASDSVSVEWQQPEGNTKRFSTEVSANLVVDAGFDNLVRRHWNKVISGESVKFRFLAPTRGTDYAFILEPAQNTDVKADHVVQIRPDSLVLNFLVDPIVLGYDDRGALTAYSGLTNVRENTDQNYTAAILYAINTYPECQLTP
ncbi:MAG: hypothetical protein ACI92B_001694 [Marinobacter maritimus]|jgi:hypothetical protein|uniref:hypothetical protein n=1 Tax=Marinobacter maritimus TaxID=277961 RepID=UPI000BCA5052|nr:hypothetical protein [Marinobacter maritimus]